jgi:hypothetical protein
MSYLHCHSCGWGQDDFWDFGFSRYGYFMIIPGVAWNYNPVSVFLSYVFSQTWYRHFFRYSLLWPNVIVYDQWFADERGWKSNRRFSWMLIGHHFVQMLLKFKNQAYWSEKSFNKAKSKECPVCQNELDAD